VAPGVEVKVAVWNPPPLKLELEPHSSTPLYFMEESVSLIVVFTELP